MTHDNFEKAGRLLSIRIFSFALTCLTLLEKFLRFGRYPFHFLEIRGMLVRLRLGFFTLIAGVIGDLAIIL